MKAIDLYAGLGVYTLALREAGIEVVAAAESEPWRAAAYREHFPGVPLHDDAYACLEAHPGVDLWCACVGVAALRDLVARPDLPPWLWLESVREPFDAIRDALTAKGYTLTGWDACGRRHLVAGPKAIEVPTDWEAIRLQHPDVDVRHRVPFEVQEAKLDLPAGWTAVAGATDRQRQGALGSASHAGMLRCVARLIAAAG